MTPLPEALPDTATALSSLMVQASGKAKLTPAQQRFNDLLARIELLSGHIQRLESWSDRYRYGHIQALRESVQQAQVHRKSLLLFVHERLQTTDFTDRQQRMARGLVRGLIEQLSASADPQVQALVDQYVSEEDTQEAAEEQAEAAQRLRERIEEALGQPLNKPSQYQTPEEMMAAGMRQWQQQQEANETKKNAKRTARKAQKQAQKKNAAAEKGEVPPALLRELDAKSAIRTIFRQLASALHPDREPDEQERLRKTGLMSEVNAAYEKNDLTTLLRLQMQVSQGSPQSTARMADDKLIAMSLLLKEQVAALEEDLDQLERRLSRELCVPVRADADEAVMAQSLQRLQADQRHMTESLESDLCRIQNEAELKRWLKEQWQLAKATFA
jgi:predicted transcriptional regulator